MLELLSIKAPNTIPATQGSNTVTVLRTVANTSGATRATPNPSIERTRSDSAGLALISFWAKPAPPPRAAHVKR